MPPVDAALATPPLTDLTLAAPGSTTVARILDVLARDNLRRAATTRPVFRESAALRRAAALAVRAAAKDAPDIALRVCGEPTQTALLLPATDPRRFSARRRAALLAEHDLQLLVALASAGALAEDVAAAWPTTLGRAPALHLPADATRIALPAGTRRVRVTTDGSVETDTGPARHERARYLPIDGPLLLALVDNNPLAPFRDHPAQPDGRRFGLGDVSAERWQAAMSEAWRLFTEHVPGIAGALRRVGRLILPVGADPETHYSASYQETIGAAWMSLHPRTMIVAEALVHELQHSVLLAAMRLDPLLENPPTELHTSPVRPDPRPLRGILLAVHAFQPVAELYRALDERGHPLSRERHWQERWRAIRAKNSDGVETLRRAARPTTAGRDVLDEVLRNDRRDGIGATTTEREAWLDAARAVPD